KGCTRDAHRVYKLKLFGHPVSIPCTPLVHGALGAGKWGYRGELGCWQGGGWRRGCRMGGLGSEPDIALSRNPERPGLECQPGGVAEVELCQIGTVGIGLGGWREKGGFRRL
ncbi:MAG: hypothetical protein QM840_07645, partial [Verrucomicrobiota bacterium]|nr:hypothetical protein [Verrucomicrobiota bacterium]